MTGRLPRIRGLLAIVVIAAILAGCWSRSPVNPAEPETTLATSTPLAMEADAPPDVSVPTITPTQSQGSAPIASTTAGTTGATGTASPAPSPTTGAPATAGALSPMETAQQALDAIRPVRDLADLAVRFKGIAPAAATPQASNGPNYQTGRQDTFWISDQKAKTYFTVTATIAYVSPHAYFYFQEGLSINPQAVRDAADAFENTSYPTVRRYFGREQPGVDGDSRVTVLNAKTLGSGIGGYFSSDDQYPRSVSQHSNERNILYIAIGGDQPGSRGYNATVAHEFQHLVSWSVNRVADTWFNEGCSELAMRLTGFGAGGAEQAYARNPNIQLTGWSDEDTKTFAHYGAGYLFLDYFLQHYGGYDALPDLLATGGRGPAAFDQYLAAKGYAARFDDVFRDWVAANYLDDRRADGGRYWYQEIDLHATAQRVDRYPFTSEGLIAPYGAKYFDFGPSPGDVTVTFTGTTVTKLLNNDAHSGRRQWWSNRGDMMDTTLTRAFDLTGLTKATLHFWTWFDAEDGYDFAYAEISADGRTWQSLPGRYTTTANPIGHNLGNGYTGRSGGSANPVWVEENIDISAYAGKKVQIRFEHVADDALNKAGFAVDDIAIPELGFRDDAEGSDNGWQALGFVRTANLVPQRYSLQLIEVGEPAKVVAIPLDSDNRARVTTQGLGSQYRRIVLAIAPFAPVTSEDSSYQVSVAPAR